MLNLITNLRAPRGLSYIERLRLLNLEPLELRRLKFDLCMVFKLCNGLVFLPCDISKFFQLSDSRIRGNCWRFRIPYCRSDVRKNFFSQHIISLWNSLPDRIVCSKSLKCLKAVTVGVPRVAAIFLFI